MRVLDGTKGMGVGYPLGKWQPKPATTLKHLNRRKVKTSRSFLPCTKIIKAPPPRIRLAPLHPREFIADAASHMARCRHRPYRPGVRGKVMMCIWFIWFHCASVLWQVSIAGSLDVNPPPPVIPFPLSELHHLCRGAAFLPELDASAGPPSNSWSACWVFPPLHFIPLKLPREPHIDLLCVPWPSSAPGSSCSVRPLFTHLPSLPFPLCRRRDYVPVADEVGREVGEAEPLSLALQTPYQTMPIALVGEEEEDLGLPSPGPASIAFTPLPALVFPVSWTQTHSMCPSRLRNVNMKLKAQLQKTSGSQLRLWTSLPRHHHFNFPLLNLRSTRQQKIQ